MTPLHSGKSGLSCTTSVGPAQYMREEMLTPSPPPNWGQNFAAQVERSTNEMEFKDEVGLESRARACQRGRQAQVYVLYARGVTRWGVPGSRRLRGKA